VKNAKSSTKKVEESKNTMLNSEGKESGQGLPDTAKVDQKPEISLLANPIRGHKASEPLQLEPQQSLKELNDS